jgi:predicted transposase/invertase (TIGR01784 family)
VLEAREHRPLSDELELHFVELPKLDGATDEAGEHAVAAWARFLAAATDEERRRLAMTHPHIQKANEALEELSRDPEAQALARWREDQLRLHRVELATAEKRGLEKGLETGLRAELKTACQILGIEWTPERDAQVAGADKAGLERLRAHLVEHRSWPDAE